MQNLNTTVTVLPYPSSEAGRQVPITRRRILEQDEKRNVMADTIAPTTTLVVEDLNPTPANTMLTTPAKPVHSLVIDTNAIITNNPSISSLIAQAEALYTIPSVVTESMLPRRSPQLGLPF